MKRILCILLMLVMLVTIAAPVVNAADQCVITIVTYDEAQPMYRVSVEYGSVFEEPNPVNWMKDGKLFGGWYKDAEYTTRYYAQSVYANFTLYPRYVDEEDIVTLNVYHSVDATRPYEIQRYVKGDDMHPVKEPEIEDDEIIYAWYTDKDFTEEFDFSQPIYEDADIYPRIVNIDDLVYIGIYLNPDDEFPAGSGAYVPGDIPSEPEEPYWDDYTFLGWYTDNTFTEKFDFSEPLYEDASIYARLVPDNELVYLAYYLDPADEVSCGAGAYAKGDIPSEPEEPYRDELYFAGWYADKNFTKLFDFSKPIYQDAKIYARFVGEEDTYIVSLYLDPADDEPIVRVAIANGRPCPRYPDPGRDYDKFGGWYNDRALKIPADFTAPRYEDVSLFPKWIPIPDDHSKLRYVKERAGERFDGVKPHYECERCGKWFTCDTPTLEEITDREALIIDAYGPYLVGDSDGDEDITILDATLIQRRLAGLKSESTFCRGAADSDGDGDTSILDATGIQRYLAGLSCSEQLGSTVG